MAQIQDELILDIDQALRAINDIEQALDRSLASVEVRVDATEARRQLDQLAQDADRALSDVDVDIDSTGAARLNEELAGVERNLTQADSEADQLAGSLREADRAADNINTTAGGLATRFGGLQTAALGVASAFAAIGVGQLFGTAIRGANAAIQSFAQLEDSINAVNVVFKDGAGVITEFGETAAQSAGLSQEAFNNAVAPIGALLTNFGFNAREAADASVILIQRGADLASVYGGSVQDALLAINSALVGQVEPLRRFGGEISQARVEAFALATGLLQAGETMDNTVAVQARLGLILQDTAVVAGDFVNTSEDLANAQRIAAAEAQNLVAVVGEALAPAFEAILVQAVPILNFFESLAPALGETATEASGAAAGLTELVSGAVLGLGAFGDIIGGAVDAFQAFPAAIEGAAAAIVDGDTSFEGFNAQLDQFNQRTANQFIRIASQSIPAAITKGFAPIDAFGQAIAFLAQQDDGLLTIQQSFERLAIQSGLTDEEIQAVTRSLIAQADTLGFSADEINFLTSQLNVLNETLDDGGRANADYIASVTEIPDSLNTVTTTFTTFTDAVGEIPDRMDSVAIEMRAAAGLMGEALNPFDGATEAIELSANEFFELLIEEINEQATFQSGIATLIMREQFDLAKKLGDQGPAVQEALTGFLEDVDLAEAANDALAGEGTKFSRAIGDELTSALESGTQTPQVQQAFIDFLGDGIFSNSQVEDAIVTGTASSAADTSNSYFEALGAEIDAFDASVLQDKLAGLFSGVTFDIDASQFNFPDSGAFQGTIGAGAVLGTLATPQTGVTGTSPVANSFGFTYAPTVINPVVEDLETTLAKNNQIMGSVAGILNGNFKL